MAKREAPRHRRRVKEPGVEELVERVHPGRRVELGDRVGELGLERVAGDRRRFEQPPGIRAESPELLQKHGRDRRGHAGALREPVRVRASRRGRRLTELQGIERVSPALRVDELGAVGARLLTDQLSAAVRIQRREVDQGQRGGGERGGERLGRHPGPEREGQQDGRRGRAADERGDQIDRGAIGPVKIVEKQDDRLAVGDELQQSPHGLVHSISLVAEDVAGATPAVRQRRERAGEGVEQLGVPILEPSRVPGGEVWVQRVRPDRQRQIPLVLCGSAAEDDMTAAVGELAQLAEESGLADPRLALDRDGDPVAVGQLVQQPAQPVELRSPTDGLDGSECHRKRA